MDHIEAMPLARNRFLISHLVMAFALPTH